MKLNDADMIYFGNQEVQKVYLGSELVWEATTKVIEVEVYRYASIISSSVEISPSITPPELDEIDYIMLDGNRIEGDQIASISSVLITFNRALYSLGLGAVQPGVPVTIHLL